MVFSESIKLKVKTKAHYKCCICNSFGFVEVHHIIPQSENGKDSIDNAVPLCVKCHDDFGGNPDKRKWIREKRDFWYKNCKDKLFNEDTNQLGKIVESIEKIHNQNNRIFSIESEMSILKNAIVDLTNKNNLLAQSLSNASTSEVPVIFNQISSGAITVSGTALALSGSSVIANRIDNELTKLISSQDKTVNYISKGLD